MLAGLLARFAQVIEDLMQHPDLGMLAVCGLALLTYFLKILAKR